MMALVVLGVLGAGEPGEFRIVAEREWERIEREYRDIGTGFYREFYSTEREERAPAFNWTVGVTLSAMNGLARGSEAGKGRLVAYLEKVEAYWNPRGPVAGYDVLPNQSGVDRYYDDNAWMVLALLEAAEVTGDLRWRRRAEEALVYVLSGEDSKLGGGVYWRESDKASKNTCSNSPSAVACFEMYRATGKAEYREAGYRLLDWVMSRLYDSSDSLMWDNVSLAGKVERTKWSYNAALTVRALRFAEASGEGGRYPVSAEAMFRAAWAKWHLGEGRLSGPGKFSHLLFEAGIEGGWLTRSEIRQVGQVVVRAGAGGRWGGSLGDRAAKERSRFELIDEASAVRVLVLADRALGR